MELRDEEALSSVEEFDDLSTFQRSNATVRFLITLVLGTSGPREAKILPQFRQPIVREPWYTIRNEVIQIY
jgi:hypothetical protein